VERKCAQQLLVDGQASAKGQMDSVAFRVWLASFGW
jgi:hypothetical protein